MGYRLEEFIPGNLYHVYNRGVEKRNIFLDDRDYLRFLHLALHCLPDRTIQSFSLKYRTSAARKELQTLQILSSGEGLVDIICFCLMPNHFHFLLKENKERGISTYMQRLSNGYAKYFNTKRERTGSLFGGPFRAKAVDGDDYLLHVSRYIHLNPVVAQIVREPRQYKWSSFREYENHKRARFCHPSLILEIVKPKEYRGFVLDHADYAQELEQIKHLLHEEEP